MEKLNQKPKIPSSPSEISVEWLNEVFRTNNTKRISSFEVDPNFGPWSLLGKAIRVRLGWSNPGDGPESAIVKFQVSTSEPRREGEVYELLSGAGVNYVPRIYSVFGNGNLVMEDLSQTHSGPESDLSPTRIRGVVTTMADFQNRFHKDTTIPKYDLSHFMNMIRINMEGWTAYQERYQEQLGDTAADFEWIAEHPEIISQFYNSEPSSLSHGDASGSNILYPNDGSDQPMFIDWQLAARRVLPFDLSYFMVKQLSAEKRREHEAEMLHTYYNSLSDELKSTYSFDRMVLGYRASATRSMLSSVMRVGPRYIGQPNQMERSDELAQKVIAAVKDLRPIEAIQELK